MIYAKRAIQKGMITKALLMKIPLVDVPFKRVAVDLKEYLYSFLPNVSKDLNTQVH